MARQDEATAAVAPQLRGGLRAAVFLAAGLPAVAAAIGTAAGAGAAVICAAVAVAALVGLLAGWRTGAAAVERAALATGAGLEAGVTDSGEVRGLGAALPGPWGPEESRRAPVASGGRLGDDPTTITGLTGSEALSETGDEVVTGAALFVRLVGLERVGEVFGRAEAEATIVRAARQILAALRDRDDILDLGDGRFVALLLGEGRAQAEVVADRVVGLVGSNVEIRGETGAVAALAGIAVAPLGAPLADLVVSAERAVAADPIAAPAQAGTPAEERGRGGGAMRRRA